MDANVVNGGTYSIDVNVVNVYCDDGDMVLYLMKKMKETMINI